MIDHACIHAGTESSRGYVAGSSPVEFIIAVQCTDCGKHLSRLSDLMLPFMAWW